MIPSTILFLFLESAVLQVQVENNHRPVSHQNVDMVGFQNGEQKFQERKLTSSSGTATFNISNKLFESETHFLVSTIVEGLQYLSPLLHSNEWPQNPIILNVFKTTTNQSSVHIKDLRYFLSSTNFGIKVDQEILIENLGPEVLIGPKKPAPSLNQETPQSLPEVFRISLPEGAYGLQLGYGFEEKETQFDRNDILSSHPITPGLSHFSMTYSLESSLKETTIKQAFSLPVQNLSLGIPTEDPIRPAASSDFKPIGTKYFGGQMASLWELKIEPSTNISLPLTGLRVNWPYMKFIPFVFLALLFLGAYFSHILIKKKIGDLGPSRKSLLEDLYVLKKMKDSQIISEYDFQRKRLVLLEEILGREASP